MPETPGLSRGAVQAQCHLPALDSNLQSWWFRNTNTSSDIWGSLPDTDVFCFTMLLRSGRCWWGKRKVFSSHYCCRFTRQSLDAPRGSGWFLPVTPQDRESVLYTCQHRSHTTLP